MILHFYISVNYNKLQYLRSPTFIYFLKYEKSRLLWTRRTNISQQEKQIVPSRKLHKVYILQQ